MRARPLFLFLLPHSRSRRRKRRRSVFCLVRSRARTKLKDSDFHTHTKRTKNHGRPRRPEVATALRRDRYEQLQCCRGGESSRRRPGGGEERQVRAEREALRWPRPSKENQSRLKNSLLLLHKNAHRPKPFLLNLLTGGGDHSASSSREQEKKERRRRRRREEEEDEEQRQLRRRREEKSKPKTSSPSLLAPCPVCGTLFRRGLELDAHVAAEVAAGLGDEVGTGRAQERTGTLPPAPPPPPPPAPLRVLLPAAAALPRRPGAPPSSSSSVFELSDARAEVSLFKKSTRGKSAGREQQQQQQQQQQEDENQQLRPLQGRRPPLHHPPKVLRLPRMEQRFNHFADGSGAWGDETLGIDGASGAQAWQARGVSGIGDPFRGASGGAAGE